MAGMGRKKGNIEMDDLTKFTARTSPALVEQMGIVIAKMRRSDVEFDRRVVPQEAAISAIILHWLEAVTAGDFGKQEAFLREWIPRYEQLLERDPPTPRAAPKPDRGRGNSTIELVRPRNREEPVGVRVKGLRATAELVWERDPTGEWVFDVVFY